MLFFFFQAEDGIRDADVTGVQTCALPISGRAGGDFRPENLLLLDPHPGLHPREYGRPVEPAALERLARGLRAPRRQLCALLLSHADVVFDLLAGGLVDEGSHLRGGLEPGAEPQPLRAAADQLDELVVHRLLDDQPARGRAALAGRTERPPQHAVDPADRPGAGAR